MRLAELFEDEGGGAATTSGDIATVNSQLGGVIRRQPPIYEDIGNYDLRSRYNEFNSLYFNDQLPSDIKLSFKSLKKVGGQAKCKVKRDQYGKREMIEGSLEINISNLFEKDDTNLDSILLHEMIHVYFYVIGDFKENHGRAFNEMRRRLSKESGINITDKEEIDFDASLNADKETRDVGVIVYLFKDRISIQLMTPTKLKQSVPQLREFTERLSKNANDFEQSYAVIINTDGWTKLSHIYPMTRSFGSTYKFKGTEQDIKDLEKGELVFDSTK